MTLNGLSRSLISSGPLPAAALAALVDQVAADGDDTAGRMWVMTHQRQRLSAEQVDRLRRSYTGTTATVAALALLCTRSTPEIVAALYPPTGRRALPRRTAEALCEFADCPDLLAALAEHPNLTVAVRVVDNDHCPDRAALTVLTRLVERGPDAKFEVALRDLVLNRRTNTWPELILEHTRDPRVLRWIATFSDLPASVAATLTTAWLIPALDAAVPGAALNSTLGTVTANYELVLDAPTAAALVDAWHRSAIVTAAPRWVRALYLADEAYLLASPAAELERDATLIPGPVYQTLAVHADHALGGDPTAWTALLRLAAAFTGTVEELLASAAAIAVPAGESAPAGTAAHP